MRPLVCVRKESGGEVQIDFDLDEAFIDVDGTCVIDYEWRINIAHNNGYSIKVVNLFVGYVSGKSHYFVKALAPVDAAE